MTAEKTSCGDSFTVEAPVRLSTLSYVQKRSEQRYQTGDPATLQILPIDDTRRPAVVLDVSRSGLKLGLHAPIPKGMEVKVCLPERVVIFGEVRYCRRMEGLYHAGVQIRDVVHSRLGSIKHISESELGLYIVGKGLTAVELLHFQDHLTGCESCRMRLHELDWILNPHRGAS